MDIRQVITDRIIAMLEKGGNEYRKEWSTAARSGFPTNGATGKQYNGVNILTLWSAAIEGRFSSNVWMTYKQAEALGGNVRKGEKANMCAFFEIMKGKAKETAQEGEEAKGANFMMCKPFWVFNVAQIDNLPESFATVPEDQKEFNSIEAAEMLLTDSGATISHGFDSAFYSRNKDQICLPDREKFTTPENYYATALHELTHWTGHKDRLNREFGKRFGDDAYAFEELVAELGAAFVAGHVGFVDATIEGHAGYLESWLKVLKSDKTAIFTACKQAGLAYDLIVNKATASAAEMIAA